MRYGEINVEMCICNAYAYPAVPEDGAKECMKNMVHSVKLLKLSPILVERDGEYDESCAATNKYGVASTVDLMHR